MENNIFHLSLKIHGIEEIEEDNSSGSSSFDEKYIPMKPTPIPYDAIQHRIVKIGINIRIN